MSVFIRERIIWHPEYAIIEEVRYMPYQRKRTLQELNLSDDFLFSKVFSDAEVCRQVLEKILKVKIKKIKFVESQKSIDLVMESKAIRLDIYVQDEEETIYNVEMQRGKHKNLAKRSRYYQGSVDLDFIQKGSDYLELCKSFVIFICTFDPFGKGRHIYSFENYCIEDQSLKLNDETTKIFLNTRGVMDDVDEEMKELLSYVENSTDTYVAQTKSELVHQLHDRVNRIKQDKRLEVEYMTLYEIFKEEFEDGKIEGKREEKVEIAKNLLDVLDDETIALKTGLTIEEVRRIRDEN